MVWSNLSGACGDDIFKMLPSHDISFRFLYTVPRLMFG